LPHCVRFVVPAFLWPPRMRLELWPAGNFPQIVPETRHQTLKTRRQVVWLARCPMRNLRTRRAPHPCREAARRQSLAPRARSRSRAHTPRPPWAAAPTATTILLITGLVQPQLEPASLLHVCDTRPPPRVSASPELRPTRAARVLFCRDLRPASETKSSSKNMPAKCTCAFYLLAGWLAGHIHAQTVITCQDQ